MEREPLVSVIVPVYNVEKYLHQCVDSIINQTYRNLEIILVDDGSPDNCGAICDEYALKDRRILVIHQENQGLSAARNAGLDIASGDYIVFVDSDDWIAEDMIQLLLSRQEQTGADMVLCNIKPFYPPQYKGWMRKVSCFGCEVLSQIEFSERLTEYYSWIYCVAWNKLYKKEIWEQLRFPLDHIHEDEATVHRVLERCSKIATIAQSLYYYRQVPDSITGQGVRIQSVDKLCALADRIVCAEEHRWTKLLEATLKGYLYYLFEFSFLFVEIEEGQKYIKRLTDSLCIALPYIMRSKSVPMRHKLYAVAIRVSPRIYQSLRKLIKKS